MVKFYVESFGPDGVDVMVKSADQIDASKPAGHGPPGAKSGAPAITPDLL